MRRRSHSILGALALMLCVGTFSFIYVQHQIQAREADAIAKNSVTQVAPRQPVQRDTTAAAAPKVKVTVH